MSLSYANLQHKLRSLGSPVRWVVYNPPDPKISCVRPPLYHTGRGWSPERGGYPPRVGGSLKTGKKNPPDRGVRDPLYSPGGSGTGRGAENGLLRGPDPPFWTPRGPGGPPVTEQGVSDRDGPGAGPDPLARSKFGGDTPW